MSAISWTTVHNGLQKWFRDTSGIPGPRVMWGIPRDGGARPTTPYISLGQITTRRIGHDWVVSSRNVTTYAGGAFTAPGGDVIVRAAHGLLHGDGPLRVSSSGTLPGGLIAGTDYWVILVDGDTFKLAGSFFDTIGVGTPITITTAGTGVHAIVGAPTFVRAAAPLRRTMQGMRVGSMVATCYADDAIDASSASAVLEDVVSGLALIREDLHRAGVGVSDISPIVSLPGRIGTALEARATMTVTFHLSAELVATAPGFERVEVTRTAPGTPVTLLVPDED